MESLRPLGIAAGTFQRDGMTIAYHRTTALNPALFQPDRPPFVRQIEMLTVDRLETSSTDEDTGAKTILKYVRVE